MVVNPPGHDLAFEYREWQGGINELHEPGLEDHVLPVGGALLDQHRVACALAAAWFRRTLPLRNTLAGVFSNWRLIYVQAPHIPLPRH